MLNALLTRVISSFGGTTAIVPCWLARALSSLSACDPEVPPVALASGAANGVHPFAGSRKAASSLSSLPVTRGGGTWDIFAVGMRNAPTTGSFSLPVLPAKTSIQVLDENRTLVARAGKFTDSFKPYDVH